MEVAARGGEAGPSGRPAPEKPEKRLAFAQQDGRELYRLANAVLRGAGTGLCLRAGIHALSWAFALVVRSRRKRLLAAPGSALLDQLLDTLRYTLFLGSLSGVYVGVDEGIANLLGRRRTAGWRAFVAGLAAGPTILLTGPRTRHHSLALYVLLRGAVLLVRCGNKPGAQPLLRALLAPSRWRHGDTALMCLASSQLLYSWLMQPGTLPPAYVHFLNHHGGQPPHLIAAVRELARRNAAGLPPARLPQLRASPHACFAGRTPCAFVHPGRGCAANAAAFLPQAYMRALPVYAPVYVVPALLVHRLKLLKPGAGQIWAKVGLGTLRSSAFLAAYCTLAWSGACAAFSATGTCTPTNVYLSCWTSGLAALLEKKSRRMELALYCASRALESAGLCLADWGCVPRARLPPRLDVAMFALAAGAIMHCYSDGGGRHRDVFRSKYLNVLDFIFGNRGLEQGAIQHVPSTQTLLAAQGLDPAGLQLRATSLAASLGARQEEYEGVCSPRSDASAPELLAPDSARTSLDC